MDAWSWVWRQLAGVYCAVGVVGSAAAMGWASTGVLFACAAAMGFLTAMTYAMVEPYPWVEWLRTGTAAGCFTLGALGAACIIGAAGLLPLLVIGLTAPWTLQRIRQLALSPPGWRDLVKLLDPEGDDAPAPAPATPGSMSDEELCTVWRRSFGQLQRARTPTEKLPVVQLRARCLEELERRHPRAVRAWLASGTRPSGDPSPFVAGPAVDDPPLDLG